jgi:putative heme-binding domain-containing protein
MPAFDLPPADLDGVTSLVRSLNLPAAEVTVPGDLAGGEKYFMGPGKCSSCHMMLGRGKAVGPDLSNIARELTVAEIRESLLDPSARIASGYEMVTLRMRNGESPRGFRRSESNFEIALQNMQGRFHLLRKNEISSVTPEKQSAMPPVKASQQELQAE